MTHGRRRPALVATPVRALRRRLGRGAAAPDPQPGWLDPAVAAALGRNGARSVVVLAHRDHPRVTRRWLRLLSDDQVTLVYLHGLPPRPPAESDRTVVATIDAGTGVDLGRQLASLGPLDLAVVTVPPGKLAPLATDHLGVLPRLLFHLKPGGRLVVDRTAGKGNVTGLAPQSWQELLGPQPVTDPTSKAFRDSGVRRSTRALLLSRRHVVLVKRHRHYYTLNERRADQVLAAREPQLDVTTMATLPRGSTESHQTQHMYGPTDMAPLPARLDHPELVLRHYRGPLGSQGHSILHAAHTVLPESYRWPWEDPCNHPRTANVSDDFVELARPVKQVLQGDFYLLDSLFPSHFGHVTTEVVGRMWGWDIAKREMPGLKALIHVKRFPALNGHLERALFAAYGIAPSDVVSTRQAVQLDSVVGASPMWHNRPDYFAHPDIRETWARLTSGLLAGAAPADHDRVFVSRGAQVEHRRGCRNQREVERYFADQGFLVLYPEEHSLGEQAAIFAGARVVAGFAGSAMFNLMHAQRLETVIVLSHSAYVHRNEQLFARLHGAQLHHFWSAHDESPDADRRTLARASWSFDFPGLRADLDRVVAGL